MFFSCYRWPDLMPIHKSIQAQASFWKYFCIALPDKPYPFPKSFCCIRTVSCHHTLDQPPYAIQTVKRILRNWENWKKKKMSKEHTSGYPAHWQWLHLLSKVL